MAEGTIIRKINLRFVAQRNMHVVFMIPCQSFVVNTFIQTIRLLIHYLNQPLAAPHEKADGHKRVHPLALASRAGIEPASTAPETATLSIRPPGQMASPL
jgi:hypothetical protein